MRNILFRWENCTGCKRCELACALVHTSFKNINSFYVSNAISKPRLKIILKDSKEEKHPILSYRLKNKKFSLQKCVHCKKPACMEVCKKNAISKTKEGFVLIDFAKCDSCFECISACKFNAIWKIKYNSTEYPLKCDFCININSSPACVSACDQNALVVR